MEDKTVSLKNYFLLSIILILSIVVVIYFYMWYGAYEENKLNTPIMDEYLSVINYNELDDYLIENKDAVIYVSVLGNNDIRIFEKKFGTIIDNYALNSSILYLNLSLEVNDDELFGNIKDKYGLENIPCIVVFKDGCVFSIFDIAYNNYNIDNLIAYFIEEGVITDD